MTLKRNRFGPLEKVRGRLQIPPKGPFYKDDITWEKQHNSGGERNATDVTKAIILWNMIPDFVEGESTSCDFPCTFLKKKRKDVLLGTKKVVKEGLYSKISR
jgi:hypothetical protein